VAAGLHRPGHSLDRAESLLASDPIDQSPLVEVTLFGQEFDDRDIAGKLSGQKEIGRRGSVIP
jgi:hypothetical protein